MNGSALEEPLEQVEPDLQAELAKYAGRWVATTRTKVVAVGDSPQDVYREARDQGIDIPIVFRVPEAGQSYFF